MGSQREAGEALSRAGAGCLRPPLSETAHHCVESTIQIGRAWFVDRVCLHEACHL